jgi:hypothetical protein
MDMLFDKSSNKLDFLVIIFCIIYFLLLIISNNYNLSAIISGFGNKIPHAGIHLVISSMIALITFFKIIKSENNFSIFLWFITGFIMLFILGSRSALSFYLFSIIILIFLKNKKNFILFSILLLLLVGTFSSEILSLLEVNHRFYSLVTLDQNDGSLEQRISQGVQNFKFISENLFTGLLMSEIIVLGKGNYIHSYLSYLQSYGIIVFTFLNILLLRIIYYLFIYRNLRNKEYTLILIAFIYVLLEFLFARGYQSFHLLMFMMFFESYSYNLKFKENNEK